MNKNALTLFGFVSGWILATVVADNSSPVKVNGIHVHHWIGAGAGAAALYFSKMGTPFLYSILAGIGLQDLTYPKWYDLMNGTVLQNLQKGVIR